jgi:peptidoglycan/LPS O-acetylase OafA/YrhL
MTSIKSHARKQPQTAAKASKHRPNSFDLLRLAAALLVLVSHSFALTGHAEPAVPGTHDTLGFDAVLVFFAISGMLVTQSWMRMPSVLDFAWRRALRILPGLLICNVATAYVLGPVLTNWSVLDYLTSSRPLRYVVGNTLMKSVILLPGMFTTNPSPTVNGSLNTLPVEVKAYVLVALIGLLVAAGSHWRRLGLGLLTVAFGWFSLNSGVKDKHTLFVLFAVFAGGAAVALGERWIRWHWWLFVVAGAVWIVSYHVPFAVHVGLCAVAVPYLVIFIGRLNPGRLSVVTRFGDFSYGIYVYAFPVQQVIIHELGRSATPARVIWMSAPLTYALGAVSWLLVERRALRLKGRYQALAAARRRRRVPDGVASA